MPSDDDLRAALTSRLPDLAPDVEAELHRLLDRAGSRTRTRRATYVVGLVAAAVVAAVLVLGHDWRPTTKGPEPVDEAPVLAKALVNRGIFADPASLEPGRYEARFLARPACCLRVEMDIPVGWGQDDVFAFATGSGYADATRRIDLFAHVAWLNPEPCHARVVRPGPDVLDLARKLASLLPRTTSTGPVPVTLGGYTGYHLRLRYPLAHAASGRCTGGGVWREGGDGVGIVANDFPGWTSLIWVLDVDGERVIIAASHGPDVTPAQEAELVDIVESASFVLP